jgi:hypothetical protein
MRIVHTRNLKICLIVGLVAVGMLISEKGFPQESAEKDIQVIAREHYQNGKSLYEDEKYAEALVEFQTAYDAKPHPVVLKSIAECKALTGDVAGAIETLELFLAAPITPGRDKVMERLEELRTMVGTVEVKSEPPGAKIVIDGQDTEKVTPAIITVNFGQREVVLTVQDYEPVTKTTTPEKGARSTSVFVNFAEEGVSTIPVVVAPVGPVPGPEQYPEVKADKPGPHPAFWACMAVAGVGLVSGTVFGTMALADEKDYNDHPTEAKKEAGERNALIADISFGIAIAAAVAGTVVLFTVDKDGKRKTKKKKEAKAKFNIVPVLGENVVGAQASVQF